MPACRLSLRSHTGVIGALLLWAPPASAQLSVSGACLSGGPTCSLFEFVPEAADRPVVLESAGLTPMSPGWSPVPPGLLDGEDQFGPFPGVAHGGVEPILSILFLHSPGFPMEFVALFRGQLGTEAKGAAQEAKFVRSAVETDGTLLAGTFGEVGAASEPGALLLLAMGLGALGVARARKVAR